MTIGSLFSGIGGLELGLEWAGLGPVRWQVEIDPYARAVLQAHWPEVERFENVKTVGKTNLASVDLICGGFPCQDVSSAGKRAGLRGTHSGLWFEFRRVVSELLPAWVVVENVASGASTWTDTVARGLAEFGYEVLPVPLAAADVGAPHRRQRVFLVATHPNAQSEFAGAQYAEVAGSPAVTPHTERQLVRNEPRRGGRPSRADQTAPPHAGWRTPVPSMVRVAHGLSGGLHRSQRIRALGNAVVPQCAEVVGHIIRELAQ